MKKTTQVRSFGREENKGRILFAKMMVKPYPKRDVKASDIRGNSRPPCRYSPHNPRTRIQRFD